MTRPLLRQMVPAFALLLAFSAAAETRSLLVLHTNDIHDHVRPGRDGSGGLPYIAGYVAAERAKRGDILLLDAGDVTEKGDMVAFDTQSKITYEAMGRMGYDAAVPGNHDFSRGLGHLEACRALLGGTCYLCINCLDGEDGGADVSVLSGKPRWEPSHVFEVNGLKVGVIGATATTGKTGVLGFSATADRIAAEAARLDRDCPLLIVLAHLGVEDCRQLAKAAPAVDLFVGGHTHELLRTPARAETGALIVQTGNYAQRIGRVELAVDTEKHTARLVDGGVVEMKQDAVPCDNEMLARIRDEEQRLCPQAARVIGRAEATVNETAMARVAAAALREKAGADIGFCHPAQVMRSPLQPGEIDLNALFLTGGQRGSELVTARLRGSDIDAYLTALYEERKGGTAWDGFGADRSADGMKTDLEPGRAYTVVMPEIEWTTRFERLWNKANGKLPATEPCAFNFTDALAAYIEAASAKGMTVDKLAESLAPRRTAKAAG